jgi:peptidoglycan/LPS O-acetylase OafA/YrhL
MRPSASPAPAVASAAGRAGKLDALTGLRIFAALAVYLSHITVPHDAPGILSNFMSSGYMGVTLFFVLSGFVLTLNYFDALSHPSGPRIWRFAVARFARIYPLYLLILVVILGERYLRGESIHGSLEHFFAMQAWSPHDSEAFAFNGPAWSISVEFFLYACFPIIAVALFRVRSIQALTTTGLVALGVMTSLVIWSIVSGDANLPWSSPASSHRWLYRTPITRLGDFVLGVLIARAYLKTHARPHVARMGGALAIFGAVVIILLMSWPRLLYTAWSWDLAYAIPSVMVIFGLAVAPTGTLSRMLSLPLCVFLGEASYAFYLCHQQLLGLFGADGWVKAVSITTVLQQIVVLAIILGVASILCLWVERPARRWIRDLKILQVSGAGSDDHVVWPGSSSADGRASVNNGAPQRQQ